MNRQEIVETVAKHLFAQGKRSTTNLRTTDLFGKVSYPKKCVYYGDDGCKCAVGILIPEEYYTMSMEYTSVLVLANKSNLPESTGIIGRNTLLLQELSLIHDSSENWTSTENMRKAFLELNTKYGHNFDLAFLDNLSF